MNRRITNTVETLGETVLLFGLGVLAVIAAGFNFVLRKLDA